jgi:hypothetical protein
LPDGLFSKPKIPFWEKFEGPWNRKYGYMLLPFGIFYGHLVYFIAFWYSLWPFGMFFAYWYDWTKKNLATLIRTGTISCAQEAIQVPTRPSKMDLHNLFGILRQRSVPNNR